MKEKIITCLLQGIIDIIKISLIMAGIVFAFSTSVNVHVDCDCCKRLSEENKAIKTEVNTNGVHLTEWRDIPGGGTIESLQPISPTYKREDFTVTDVIE